MGKLPSVVGSWRGRLLNKVYYGEGPTPYPFLYHVYLLLTNGTPFAYRVKNATFLLTVVNALSFNCELIANYPASRVKIPKQEINRE